MSLTTLGPRNCGDFNPWTIGGLPTMNWHDLFTLKNLLIGTSGHDMTQVHSIINIGLHYIRNTSEYIPKLQFHQHSLLTRKVFSRHNFYHWSSSLDHLIICIFKSSLSSSYLHLGSGSSSLDLDHHSIWIIIGTSSLDLDHHWVNIIGAISWFFSSYKVLQS